MIFDAADAHEHDGVGKARIVGRNDEVARPRQQQAPRDAGPLHRRDGGLGNIAPALGVAQIIFGFPFMNAEQAAFGYCFADTVERSIAYGFRTDIVTGGEMLAFGAQQDDAHRLILRRFLPRFVQLLQKRFILRVRPVGAIQRDRRDAILHRITDKLCHFPKSPAPLVARDGQGRHPLPASFRVAGSAAPPN
jgi:hypothetical protein